LRNGFLSLFPKVFRQGSLRVPCPVVLCMLRRPVPAIPAELLSRAHPVKAERALAISRLDSRFEESRSSLKRLLSRGIDKWVIAYSGGKDSTATVALTLELVRSGELDPESVEIIYCDTMMEIPILQDNAFHFLQYLDKVAHAEQLPVKCRIVKPDVREGFWFLLLGKGYPPPHQRFRWCTRRLKITPSRKLVRNGDPKRTCILTGVRFRESRERDRQLQLSCTRGGECGQGVWFWQSKGFGISFAAPIVNWSDCDVWDFLRFLLPPQGYPTLKLYEIYRNGNDMRFGCWMCTVVRQDRTMMKLTEANNLAYLKPLLDYRNYVMDVTNCQSHRESRVTRPDGNPGRLTIETRRMLFDRLLTVEKSSGLRLITEEEKAAILRYWSE